MHSITLSKRVQYHKSINEQYIFCKRQRGCLKRSVDFFILMQPFCDFFVGNLVQNFFGELKILQKHKKTGFLQKKDSFFWFSDVFLALLYIFPMLNAMAKMAKSILILSSPKWRKRLHSLFDFICPKTGSGSIGRCFQWTQPSSEVKSSRAFFLYWFNVWLISILRLPCTL